MTEIRYSSLWFVFDQTLYQAEEQFVFPQAITLLKDSVV